MSRLDGIRIALASLIENPLRTFLTLLGIAMGVTAVIFVVSVIEGLNQYVADTLSELGPDVFIIDKYGVIKNHTEWIRAQRRNRDLTVADAEAIRRHTTLIARVGMSKDRGGSVKYGSNAASGVSIHGLSFESQEIEPIEIERGRGFTAAEADHAVRVCVLGWEIADKLFGRVDPLDREVTVWERRFRVIGVAAKRGSIFGVSQDNFTIIPLATFHKIRGARDSVRISARARDPERVDEAIDEARALMRARRHLRYDEDDDFGLITSAGLMDFWRDMTQMIFRVAIFVVSISLVVGGIVIMNIMLLTVVERTREIGVRKAVGARQRDIRFQFLVESVMLCAAGGVIGVALAWAGSWAVRFYTALPARFPFWAPLLAVAISSAVGIFFGLHPARKAAGLDPIEALRSEET